LGWRSGNEGKLPSRVTYQLVDILHNWPVGGSLSSKPTRQWATSPNRNEGGSDAAASQSL